MKLFSCRLILVIVLYFLVLSHENLMASGYTYHWGHPSPQGNTVYNMAFENELTGWAVTGCGLILKTENGGESWEISRNTDSVCIDLYDIVISSQGTLIASGDGGTILRSSNGGINWHQFTYPDAGRLYDLAQIPGGGLSAAGQNGIVLVSSDDGISWTNIGPGGTGYARQQFWKSSSEAYVVGLDMFYRTVDGGITWTEVAAPPAFGLNEVYFVNANTGYAVEDFGYWKTTDGGMNWNHVSQFSGIDYRFRTLVLDEQHWFAVSNGEGGVLWETTDAGENWTSKFDYNITGFLCLVKNGNRMLFGSDAGDIFYTNDNGQTVNNGVENLSVFPSAPVTVIGKRPDGILFSNNQPNSGTNNQTFLRSDNGGMSWYIPPQTPGLRWVNDIQFFDNDHGVLGSYQDIRYTMDGGNTWNTSALPANYNIVNFALPGSNLYFASAYKTTGGAGGNIYKSIDKGITWQLVNGGLPVNDLYFPFIAFADENTGFVSALVANQPKIYKTTDAGISWEPVNQSGISNYISGMLWLDESTGLCAVPNGDNGIYRTTDGGVHWTKTSAAGARHFTGTNAIKIAAVAPGNAIFQESQDGGITWSAFAPPFAAHIPGGTGVVESIQITDKGYILGGDANRLMVAQQDIATDEKEPKSPATAGNNISVNPNPLIADGIIRINIAKSSEATLSVIDEQGHFVYRIMKQYLPAGIREIPLKINEMKKYLSPGVYFITLITTGIFDSAKVIIPD
jgi:photosystem II stability/assembly factor-like uncharacterized protein